MEILILQYYIASTVSVQQTNLLPAFFLSLTLNHLLCGFASFVSGLFHYYYY